MVRTCSLVIALLGFSGCAHSHVVTSAPPAELANHFNRTAKEKIVTIERVGGAQLTVLGPTMEGDQVLWHDASQGEQRRLPIAEINQLRFNDTGRGAGRGFLIGMIPGMVVVGAGAASNCNCSTAKVLGYSLLGALPTGLLGVVVGAAVGVREQFAVGIRR